MRQRPMRLELTLLTVLGFVAAPAVANAQECPPGGWFCEEDAEAPDAAGAPEPDTAAPTGAAEEVELPAESEDADTPAVVVIKTDDDTKVMVVSEETAAPPPPEPVNKPYSEWGFNLRLEAALMGDDETKDSQAGMGGLGFSFRYRPVPNFAFDVGLDFLGGRDWYGYRRQEQALLFNGIIFFNPYDPVQVYTLGGFGFAGAEVDIESTELIGNSVVDSTERRNYSYFGGQLGAGLEFRVGKRSALNVDVLGFIRGRTDDAAETEPEFVDPNDPTLTTNTSGGGLLRGGVTFYW